MSVGGCGTCNVAKGNLGRGATAGWVLGGGVGGEGCHVLIEEDAEKDIEGEGEGIEDGTGPKRNLDAIKARHGISCYLSADDPLPILHTNQL